ncbi:MAG TPA: tRNA uridine-5-carboxymethylaminomethyl(34) synthesis GTPase MnmE [Methylocella sp.]|nr:tRNA uridine-5-carboxymethylaminomethyl(34) synthesis GTPase MnmE [Methylocella sp.]
MSADSDTIFAVASGAGRAAIAVLRLSGPATPRVLKSLTGRLPAARLATLIKLQNPADGIPIDKGVVIYSPAPKSFTGEDYAEFHVHGGRAILAAMIEALSRFDGTRPAEPGEFTRRALLNGKLDLAQAEGLGDLIAAETEAQRRQAMRQTEGVLGAKAAQWRQALTEATALLSAEIDFPEEEDVAREGRGRMAGRVGVLCSELKAELVAGSTAERLREGLTIVIAGPPNAGKSTLLNTLARREVAIVSPFAGTTRDALEVHLDLDGYPVTLIDTAGLRETEEAVERIGVSRAREKAEAADLVLWLSEATHPLPPAIASSEIWPILTKSDLLGEDRAPECGTLAISAATGRHIDRLIERLAGFARQTLKDGHAGLIVRARHRRACESALQSLERILADPESPAELLAEDLRAARTALESLTGAIDVEEILGEIFSRFCIGK